MISHQWAPFLLTGMFAAYLGYLFHINRVMRMFLSKHSIDERVCVCLGKYVLYLGCGIL